MGMPGVGIGWSSPPKKQYVFSVNTVILKCLCPQRHKLTQGVVGTDKQPKCEMARAWVALCSHKRLDHNPLLFVLAAMLTTTDDGENFDCYGRICPRRNVDEFFPM